MWVCAIKPRTLKTIQRLWSAVWTRRKQHFLAQNKAKRKENVPKQEEETRELWRWKPFKLRLKDCLSQSGCKSLVWRRVQSLRCSFFRYSSDAKYLLVIGVFSLKRVHWRSGGAVDQHPPPPPPLLSSLLLSFQLTSRRLRPLLSPLERGAFDSLAVSVDARRAGVQLDEQLGEFELGEHGLQEALQEDVDQAAVHGLVLKHVENAEDALSGGVCADDVLQLI